jgi:hypothetical protein
MLSWYCYWDVIIILLSWLCYTDHIIMILLLGWCHHDLVIMTLLSWPCYHDLVIGMMPSWSRHHDNMLASTIFCCHKFNPLLGGSLERRGGMACGEIPPIELGGGRKQGGWLDIPGPVLIANLLHYAAPPPPLLLWDRRVHIHSPHFLSVSVEYCICVNVS